MTYKETCDYLFNQMPAFEHQGASGYKEGLDTILALDEHFGRPHKKYHTIHVAGTNGKGSTAHTLSAILQMCGYRVGLYTSPHLVDFSERIRVNGVPISESYVVEFVEAERAYFEPLHPSFFEVTTAMAFKYFAEKDVEIAVIEVGLGGRLDCTNIITPLLSVITNIGIDHTQFLGKEPEQIAMEKAGIIKEGVPVVIGEAARDIRTIFESVAAEVHAPIVFAEDHSQVQDLERMPGGKQQYRTADFGIITGELIGEFQVKNTNTVLCVVKQLEKMGILCEQPCKKGEPCMNREVREGFLKVCELTGLKGRWQTVSKAPHVVCDTGHNISSWEYLSQQLKEIKCDHMHIIFALLGDKDHSGIMSLLPKNATYYFTRVNNKRALSENVLKIYAAEHELQGDGYADVAAAYEAAKNAAGEKDFIFVGGSNYVVAEFLKNCI